MTIIDVDAHFEPVDGWLDEFPTLKRKLPQRFPDNDPRFTLNTPEMFAFFVSDDLLRQVPAGQRMPIEKLTTPAMSAMYMEDPGFGFPGASMAPPAVDPGQRIAWLNQEGIALQNVITGTGYTLARVISDPVLGMETLEAVNTWMTDALADYDRLLPVVTLRYDDLDWVVGELTRMRARGCRAFLISSEPVGGIPPTHPDFDKVWAAACDLGMVAILHVGLSPAMFHPGWANTDDPALIRLISVLQPSQSAQVFLTAMVFGGVFERHPKLTVLIAEHGIDWLLATVRRLDPMADSGVSPLIVGDYRLPLKPSEYIRRNVRLTPLPNPMESPVQLLEEYPEVAVFSSDYPHFEGSGTPTEHYAEELTGLDDRARSSFLRDNIAASYAQMGDPLPL